MHVQKYHSAMHFSHECLGLDCKPCMQVCSDFLNGFPDWWESCKPCNSGVDSTQFYLEKFEQGRNLISKFQDILGSFSYNDAVFQKSSHSLNGTPIFEEYTCDGDIATNENAAASSEAATGKCKGDYLEASVSFSPTNISFQ
jgi:hypothetical protein